MPRKPRREKTVTPHARTRARGSAPPRSDDAPSVAVCRGGDCGSRRKTPQLDHQEQLRALRNDLRGIAEVEVTRCLDACERSNVVVVSLDDGEPATWIGDVNDMEITRELIHWVTAGGDRDQLPVSIDLNRFAPTQRNRRELRVELGR